MIRHGVLPVLAPSCRIGPRFQTPPKIPATNLFANFIFTFTFTADVESFRFQRFLFTSLHVSGEPPTKKTRTATEAAEASDDDED